MITVVDVVWISDIPEESILCKSRKRLDQGISGKVLATKSVMIVGNSDLITATDATGMPTSHTSGDISSG